MLQRTRASFCLKFDKGHLCVSFSSVAKNLAAVKSDGTPHPPRRGPPSPIADARGRLTKKTLSTRAKGAPKGAPFALCGGMGDHRSSAKFRHISNCILHLFADLDKSANRKNAPWFRVIFAPAKIELGEAQEVLEKRRTDGAIKRHVFCFFLKLFLSKRKSQLSPRGCGKTPAS